ncbi:MAG: peptide ABC transporter ATP-binding protein, partial [Oscillospiraceae bacterium]
YALLRSVPRLATNNKDVLYSLKGTPPNLLDPPPGCPFAARCEFGMNVCRNVSPEYTVFSDTQKSACWLHHQSADISGVPEILVGGAR